MNRPVLPFATTEYGKERLLQSNWKILEAQQAWVRKDPTVTWKHMRCLGCPRFPPSQGRPFPGIPRCGARGEGARAACPAPCSTPCPGLGGRWSGNKGLKRGSPEVNWVGLGGGVVNVKAKPDLKLGPMPCGGALLASASEVRAPWMGKVDQVSSSSDPEVWRAGKLLKLC